MPSSRSAFGRVMANVGCAFRGWRGAEALTKKTHQTGFNQPQWPATSPVTHAQRVAQSPLCSNASVGSGFLDGLRQLEMANDISLLEEAFYRAKASASNAEKELAFFSQRLEETRRDPCRSERQLLRHEEDFFLAGYRSERSQRQAEVAKEVLGRARRAAGVVTHESRFEVATARILQPTSRILQPACAEPPSPLAPRRRTRADSPHPAAPWSPEPRSPMTTSAPTSRRTTRPDSPHPARPDSPISRDLVVASQQRVPILQAPRPLQTFPHSGEMYAGANPSLNFGGYGGIRRPGEALEPKRFGSC